MAQPTPYDRQANFTNEESLNPTGKTPGTSLDAEFNSVKVSLDQTQANLALIQRDDGRLANASVGQDQLAPSLSIGFTLRGGWEAPENYVAGDGVTYDNSFWRAVSSHTSSPSSPPALGNALWAFLYSVVDIVPITVPDGSISTAKLANLAVETAKIADTAVTTAKLATNVLTADATGRAKMGDGFVDTAKLLDANVTTVKIADDNVTNAKLANMAQATIKGRAVGVGTGDPTDLTPLQAATVIGAVIQMATAVNTAYGSTVSTLPIDNTAPQRTTEATDLISLAFTPKSATSVLQIRGFIPCYVASLGTAGVCLFVDGTASAVAVAAQTLATGYYAMIPIAYDVVSGSTSARTYVLAAGGNVTVYVNGNNSTKIFGTSMFAQLTITEIQG